MNGILFRFVEHKLKFTYFQLVQFTKDSGLEESVTKRFILEKVDNDGRSYIGVLAGKIHPSFILLICTFINFGQVQKRNYKTEKYTIHYLCSSSLSPAMLLLLL